ncbi:uncharacterized protein [Aegilops tauschii subsp. strangulata]|uniref:uncharacterized protein n=1 Tax=Aegilops tauschii subsp. strangulata TaxID=200361 RepID=UPI000989CA37|nr:uncharacterized protein LOC109774516 [Aegilops tauschii subsp. strangulata]
MLSRARSTSGYRHVRASPSGVYYAEIRSGDTRLGLGTFETAHDAARAYEAASWCLRRPRAQMNFSDARTRQQAQDLTPSPRLITAEDRCIHRRLGRRLLIAEADEHAMTAWRKRFPEDVAAKNEFWAQRAVDRADRRERKALAVAQCELGSASTFYDNYPRWEDAFLSLD